MWEGSEMEKETSSLVSLGIVLIAIATVIAIGFGIFSVGKRLANNGQNDLVTQVDQINQSTFTELNQQVVTGTSLKGIIHQLSSSNYAVLLNTTALRNNQAHATRVTGDLATSVASSDNPYTMVMTNYPSESSNGTKIMSTAFINYNALLKNGCTPTSDVFSKGSKVQIDGVDIQPSKIGGIDKVPDESDDGGSYCGGRYYDAASNDLETFKTLEMTDSVFVTDLEFISDTTTGNIMKNTKTADFNRQGTTMYIDDAAEFDSYCIKDSSDNYVGLAFIQIQK